MKEQLNIIIDMCLVFIGIDLKQNNKENIKDNVE